MKTLTIVIPLVVILVLTIYSTYSTNRYKDAERKYKNVEDRILDKQLTKQGGTSLYFPPNWDKEKDGSHFNYCLKSYDGGKNWYAIDNDKYFEEVAILGKAEDIYPGFLEYEKSMDNLKEYVRKNGPIDPTDSIDVGMLNNAGFTVKK